jgi:hypothetical protein
MKNILRKFRPFTEEEIDILLDSKTCTDIGAELEVRSIQEMDRAFFLMLEMNKLQGVA